MTPQDKTIIERQLQSQEERIVRNLHLSVNLNLELLTPTQTTNPQ